jgi:hypothetical protein
VAGVENFMLNAGVVRVADASIETKPQVVATTEKK